MVREFIHRAWSYLSDGCHYVWDVLQNVRVREYEENIIRPMGSSSSVVTTSKTVAIVP